MLGNHSSRIYPVINGVRLLPPSVVAERLHTTRERVYAARDNGVLHGCGPRSWIREDSVEQIEEWLAESVSITQMATLLDLSRATANRMVHDHRVYADNRWGWRVSRAEIERFATHELVGV